MITKKKHSRSVYFRESYLWEKIEKKASDQKRSVNNYLEFIVSSYLLNEELKSKG